MCCIQHYKAVLSYDCYCSMTTKHAANRYIIISSSELYYYDDASAAHQPRITKRAHLNFCQMYYYRTGNTLMVGIRRWVTGTITSELQWRSDGYCTLTQQASLVTYISH